MSWLSERVGAVLGISAALGGLAAIALLGLQFDVGLVSMLPTGSSRFADYQRFVERFGAQDLAIALVRAPDRTTASRFADAFGRALERRPEILQVRARVDRRAFLRALADGALPRLLPVEQQGEIARRLSPESVDAAVDGMRSALSAPGSLGLGPTFRADPLGLSLVLGEALARSRPDRALAPGSEALATPDGRRVLLLIRPARPGYDLPDVERLAAALDAAERQAGEETGAQGVEVAYTGAFAHAREDSVLLRHDISVYIALAIAGVLGVFFAGYRDLRILPFVTYHLTITTLSTLALGIVFLGRLDLMSLAFAAIFYGIGIDAAIHFYTRFLEERAAGGEAGLARTIDALLWPTLVATATTAIAFAVIGHSSLRGVAQLGVLTAVGLLLNVPGTFVVLSALLLWFERRGMLVAARPPTRAVWLAWIAGGAARHRRFVLPLLAAVGVFAGIGASRVSLDTDLFHLRPATSKARAVEEEIRREFGFTDPHGSVLIETERVGDPAATEGVLRVAEDVTERLRIAQQRGEVASVTSPAPLLPSKRTQAARLAGWKRLPRAAAADRLETSLERAGFRVEPFGEALRLLRGVPEPIDATARPLPGLEILVERQVERDASALSVLVAFSPTSLVAFEQVASRLPDEVRLPAGVTLVVTGRPLMEAALGRAARREATGFLAVVLVLTASLIGLRERRLRPTLALLAVPIAAVVAILGLAGWVGLPLTPVSVIVLPLTAGIGFDDSLYLAERYRETGDVAEAVAQGGRALSITTATTIAGFGALALSRYPALSGLGGLAALSFAICLGVTLVLLPAMLSPAWLRGSARVEEVAP